MDQAPPSLPPPLPNATGRFNRVFRLRWYTVTLLIVSVLVGVVLGLVRIGALPPDAPPGQQGEAVGGLLGALLWPPAFAAVVAVPVYFISGRRTIALNIAASAVLGLVLLGFAGMCLSPTR